MEARLLEVVAILKEGIEWGSKFTMFFIFLIGPAGSGKSTLSGALYDWLLDHELDAAIVNLDPGADWLPYKPDVDVRDFITVEEVMEKYNLGPNGAIIAAADLVAVQASRIREELEGLKADYIVVDTPGQMELFAFRAAGLHITNTLVGKEGAIVLFLVDVIFASKPSGLISALFLSSSVQFRFMLPQLMVLTKRDLLDEPQVTHIIHLLENPQELSYEAEQAFQGMYRELAANFCRLLADLGSSPSIVSVSAVKGEGLDELYAMIQRVCAGGEDYVVHY